MKRIVASATVFAVLSSFFVHATSYINPTTYLDVSGLEISFWVPSGFEEDAKESVLDGQFTYVKHYGGVPSRTIWFSVDSAGERLSEESNYHLRGTAESKYGFPALWGDLCLQAERTLEWYEEYEEPIVLYSIRLPVEPEAITVQMAATEGVEPEMRALFREFLAKLSGETNWNPQPSVCDEVEQPK